MSLANFFDKAAFAASQILNSFDYSTFAELLNAQVVGIIFDDAAAASSEGKMALELTVNLAARLYPRIAIIASGSTGETLAATLTDYASLINPDITVETTFDRVSVCLVVGSTPTERSVPTIYIGSDNWLVKMSSTHPVGVGNSRNPFGAGAAACFGAANIFRILFNSYLPNGKPDQQFVMSLLDFDPDSLTPANPGLAPANIGESYLVGLGAIGNGAIWALSRVPDLQGILHLIDDETVELTNLQRYVLTNQDDIAKTKTALGAAAFSQTGLTVHEHQQRWGAYLQTRENWYLERVLVSVDSVEDRCAIQAALPRWIVNAWTQPGDLGISRHTFIGDQACLMCMYFPQGKKKNRDQIIADAIGLPDACLEVRKLLYTGEAIGQGMIERIANALKIPSKALMEFSSRPLRALYSEAICSGIVLRLQGNNNQANAEVPMAFQSALAGIMLAAELLANVEHLKQPSQPVTTRIDLLQPLGSYLSSSVAKDPSGYCICQDKDYVNAYQAKYGASV